MILNDYLQSRDKLLRKVCFRSYVCGDISKMVIVNIRTQTTAYLEGISALFFEKLAYKEIDEIENFAKQNELTREDIGEFIIELKDNGIIGNCGKIKHEAHRETKVDTDKDEIIAFERELYHYGYLFSTHIDITYDCNLRCVHCYHTFDEYEGKKLISLAEMKKYIDDVYELGVFHVTLSGGEVLLRDDFQQIIEYITSKGMVIYILTNGTLIDKKAIEVINRCNVQKIGVSLYSIEDSIHDEITKVKGSCQKTKEALHMLKSTDAMIGINCMLMKSNFSQYTRMNDFCKSNNFSLKLDTSMTPRLDGNEEPISLRPTYEQMIEYSLDSDYDFFVENNKELQWDGEPCQAGRVSIYCNPSGEIYPCLSFQLKLGNIQSIKEIWHKSNELHEWQNIKIKDFKGCGEKDYCKYCIEVCAGVCQLERKDYLNGETSNCIKAKARYEAYKRLQK